MSTTTKILPADGELVSLIKCRNQAAFDCIYDKYAGALFGIILKTVPDSGQAAIILHETFVFTWLHIDQYHAGRTRLFTWMLQVAAAKAGQHNKSMPSL